ncbi:MAG: sigma 54-interacting transcriptional regulator, partial [Polyangiaceae bacterium]
IVGREADGARVHHFAARSPGRDPRPMPLKGESISRRQIEIDFGELGGLLLTNRGKATVHVNGTRVAREHSHAIEPGDVVTLGSHYAFLVGERAVPPSQSDYPTTHAFGGPDAHGLVGESAAMWALRDRLAAAAAAKAHVLVLGETGVGKELATRAIHALSNRARKPYVARNAATLPDGVFDTELFGCAKDFPNAPSDERKGLVGDADGGTLMLDEIGTISTSLQAKLLTFLDAGSYFRVGESRERRADVRVIAATNVAVGDLKNDLGPRFKLKVHVPPIGERREDIPLLARHLGLGIVDEIPNGRRFVGESAGRPYVRMSCDFVAWLVTRAYRGNTRELEEVLREAMLASGGDTVHRITEERERKDLGPITKEILQRTLAKHDGNQTRAGKELGITRFKMKRWMDMFGIPGKRPPQ